MSDIQDLIESLKSDNSNERDDAYERLRVSRQLLPMEAIEALRRLTNDKDRNVAAVAQRVLDLHDPAQIALHTAKDIEAEKNLGNSSLDKREGLWQIIFIASIVLSLVSAYWAFAMMMALALGGWALEGAASFVATIVFFYILPIHPLLVFICPIRSWYFHKKNKHAEAIQWAIAPIIGLLTATLLYFLVSAGTFY